MLAFPESIDYAEREALVYAEKMYDCKVNVLDVKVSDGNRYPGTRFNTRYPGTR